MLRLRLLLVLLLAGCGSSPNDDAGPNAPPSGSGGRGSDGAAMMSAGGSGGAQATGGSGGAAGELRDAGMPDASEDAGPDRSVDAGVDAGEAPPDPSAELFDPERVPVFEIELPEESTAALDKEPETYVHGTLHYGSESIADIGVRIKGEASMRKLTQKAAFKLKFDEFVPKQSFRGLRRMTLNNMVEDPSFMGERLAYYVFRAMDLPAPRANSARVRVNGKDFGVYANIETEDKTFLRRWFTSDDGNLYEEGEVDFVPGAETEFDLETNETADDRSDLRALIAALDGSMSQTYLAEIGAQLDVDHFLRFSATEAAVNQWDMYAYTMYFPNNFRVYRDPIEDKFVFLPWGMDMAMKPFSDTHRPFVHIYELTHLGDNEDAAIVSGLLFRRCLESPACKQSYAQHVADVADDYQKLGLPALAERYYDQIKDLVYEDTRKEFSNAQFEEAYQSLLDTVEGRVAALRADLAAE